MFYYIVLTFICKFVSIYIYIYSVENHLTIIFIISYIYFINLFRKYIPIAITIYQALFFLTVEYFDYSPDFQAWTFQVFS